MNKAALDLLKYLYVKLRLTADSQSVVAPNGKVVTRVLTRTITECVHNGWIELDPATNRYRLTDAGRDRVLVKERVREFVSDLTNQQPA